MPCALPGTAAVAVGVDPARPWFAGVIIADSGKG